MVQPAVPTIACGGHSVNICYDHEISPEDEPIIHAGIRYKTSNHFNDKEDDMGIQEGKAAPTFSLPDAAGKMVNLKDFKGKHVVVYFYPKDNTSG